MTPKMLAVSIMPAAAVTPAQAGIQPNKPRRSR